MTATIPAVDFELAIARSQFIDAFNSADGAIRARLISLKGKPEQQIGSNIDLLRKVAAGPQYSKAEKTKVESALDELLALRGLRCDIVHSEMNQVTVNRDVFGFFPNVQKQPCIAKTGLLISLSELRDCTARLRNLVKIIGG